MSKLLFFTFPLTVILLASCTTQEPVIDNPFFTNYNTPFNAPPFDNIKSEHYLPAFEEAIRRNKEEINTIVNNPDEPSFENTIVAFDKTGQMLRAVSAVFGGLRSAETNDELQQIAQEITPMLSSHGDDIRFNQELFNRIKTVYDKRKELNLNKEDGRLLRKIYEDFARNGAALPEDKREELRKINEKKAMLSLKLNENLLNENNDFRLIIEDESDLVGLPENVILAAAEQAEKFDMKGKWVFTLAKPSWIPFLQFSQKRELREKLYNAYINRGNNNNEFDNKALFIELMQLRQEKAIMLGFENYAAYFTSIQMAKTPANVYSFLYEIWEPSLKRAKAERDAMQAIIDREKGGYKLESWDWWYYAEKLRKEKYDLNEDELKPYFTLENVKQGNFILTEKLFGLKYEKRPNVPVYHSEVETYEVFDKDGSSLGILYIDPHPRQGKRGGAWCGAYRAGSYDENGNRITPIVYIVMNFTRPSGDNPAMLSWDETRTYFHEFGHAIHNFFAMGKYNRTSRSVPRDFVELPSQILENWVGEPELLKEYALHYKTKEPIPDYLIEKIKNAEYFNQGFINTEYLAAAILDMDWHISAINSDTDVNEFEKKSLKKMGLIKEIIPRYRTTNFGHIFSPGYAAGYYVYRWAGVLDSDAFYAFKETDDLFNKEVADRFRKYILAENSIWEGMNAYKEFRGKEPSIEPFLVRSGLK